MPGCRPRHLGAAWAARSFSSSPGDSTAQPHWKTTVNEPHTPSPALIPWRRSWWEGSQIYAAFLQAKRFTPPPLQRFLQKFPYKSVHKFLKTEHVSGRRASPHKLPVTVFWLPPSLSFHHLTSFSREATTYFSCLSQCQEGSTSAPGAPEATPVTC